MQRSLQIRTISLHNFQEKAFFVMITLIAFTVALYLYFVSATILRIVDRTSALGDAKILDTKISVLESEYMSYGTIIDLPSAKTLGYQEVAKIDYVSRITSLSFANSR